MKQFCYYYHNYYFKATKISVNFRITKFTVNIIIQFSCVFLSIFFPLTSAVAANRTHMFTSQSVCLFVCQLSRAINITITLIVKQRQNS